MGLFVAILFLTFLGTSDGSAAISIDLGCENIEMGIVKPQMPMEIILNFDSSRKITTTIGIKDDEILVGDAATIFCQRKPKDVFLYTRELLGKNLYNSEIEEYHSYFPQYDLTSVRGGKAFAFQHKNEVYTPEDLIAMILSYCKEVATAFADKQPIVGYVITVPPYFNQAERRAVMRAAQIADIKIIQIMNENAAVALNYGLFRQKSFNATPQYFVFYDMGACGTHASVVAYQLVQTKEQETASIYPQLTIKGFGFDRTLGGRMFQLRLRDYIATQFNEQKHPSNLNLDVTKDARAMSKIYVEAGKAIKILSANSETTVQIENVIEEQNLKINVKRSKFEEICADLFDRATKPLLEAIQTSGLQLNDIEQVILFGAATRMPKLQDVLLPYTKNSELGKSLNTDEAAALGAVYQAAYLSQGFRAKRFIIKDATPYPIKIEFEKDLVSDEEFKNQLGQSEVEEVDKPKDEKLRSVFAKKAVEKVLMPRFNPCPQKKVITFNKNFEDFTFNVSYGDLGFLDNSQIHNFASLNLTRVAVKGIRAHLAKYASDPTVEFKGVKAHFSLDENCLVSLDKVDIHFEKSGPKPEEESAFSKIGSKIKNFFTGLKGDAEQPSVGTEDSDAENGDGLGENSASKKGDESKNEEADKSSARKLDDTQGEKETSDQKNEEALKNTEANDAKGNENLKTENTPTPSSLENTTYHISEPLKFDIIDLDFPQMTPEEVVASQKRLTLFKAKENERKDLAETRNNLESLIFTVKDKAAHDEVFLNFSTPEERSTLLTRVKGIEEWYENDGHAADKKALKNALAEVKACLKPVDERITEYDKVYKSLDKLMRTLNDSQGFVEVAENLSSPTSALPIFTPIEITKLRDIVVSTAEWFNATVEKLSKAQLNQDPTVNSIDIKEKWKELDREVSYLRNKGRTEAMNQAKKLSEDLKFKEMKDKLKEEMEKATATSTGATSESVNTATSSAKDRDSKDTQKTEKPQRKDSKTNDGKSTTTKKNKKPSKDKAVDSHHDPDDEL